MTMMVPGDFGRDGPFMIRGSLWRRWARDHPEESFDAFLLDVSLRNLDIRASCSAVSSETLLDRRIRREKHRAQSDGISDPPLVLQVPKGEPIELSSDSSDSDVDYSKLRNSSSTTEARQQGERREIRDMEAKLRGPLTSGGP